ncbi:MAG: succinoglycan biosynthesis protein ExoO [Actinomycetota bacterium]|nr:succinoglycan biosynthesis protein ExoO [Actinomycetota bacterium]
MIIPTKDRADIVEKAIGSCLDQQGISIEVIVVADGSSQEQADAYAGLVTRIGSPVRLLYDEGTRGPGAARNRGIEAADGRYLAVLDDDNLFLPGMLAAQHLLVEGADDVVAVCGVEILSPDGRTIVERPRAMAARSLSHEPDPFAVVRPRAFWATFFAPVDMIRDAGAYDADIWFGEHTELLLRLLDRARFATRPEVGTRVHRHYGLSHASRAWERKAEGTRLIMERHAARFDRMPDVKARWLDVLGMTYLRQGRGADARHAFVESVRAKPSARALAHLAGAATGTGRWLAPGGGDVRET